MDFWKVMVPVPSPYLDHKKQHKKIWTNPAFLHSIKLFYEEKIYKFHQIYCKMRMKKIFNAGNQIYNFISGSGTVINYGSDSDFLTSYASGSASQ